MTVETIKEYQNKMEPWGLFKTHTIPEIRFQTDKLDEMDHIQGMFTWSDSKVVIHAPSGISGLLMNSYTNRVAHELGHAAMYFLTGNARTSNNTIHFAVNTNSYQYVKRLADPRLIVFAKLTMYLSLFDVKALLDNEHSIANLIFAGQANEQPSHPYFR